MQMLRILGAVLLLAGCVSEEASYGQVPNLRDVRFDPVAPVMPANAPSMSQLFRVSGDGGADHNAIDIIAGAGAPVLAAADGLVHRSFHEPMFGNVIIINHGVDPATGRKMRTRSVHLQDRLVETGEQVKRGQIIGRLGNTGVLSARVYHLHFELYRGEEWNSYLPVNPNAYWVNGPGKVTCFAPDLEIPAERFAITYPARCR